MQPWPKFAEFGAGKHIWEACDVAKGSNTIEKTVKRYFAYFSRNATFSKSLVHFCVSVKGRAIL